MQKQGGCFFERILECLYADQVNRLLGWQITFYSVLRKYNAIVYLLAGLTDNNGFYSEVNQASSILEKWLCSVRAFICP